MPGGKSRMKNQKEKNNRTSHFCGLGKGQFGSHSSLGLRLRGLPL